MIPSDLELHITIKLLSLVTLPELQLPADCQKLKRHIALFCDRLQKVSSQTTTQPLKSNAAPDPHPPRGGGLPTLDEETDL